MSVATRRRSLIVPREHGAWGLLLVPLVTGAAVGLFAGGRGLPLIPLTVAILALFWLRTPVESWWGTSPMRAQSDAELRLVRSTVFALAGVSVVGLAAVLWAGRNQDLWWIGASAALAFLAQACLTARKRARLAAQVVGAAGLSSAAPAAYVATTGHWTEMAAALWIANWLFAVNQIQFVQLRIHGSRAKGLRDKLSIGRSFFVSQICLLALLLLAGRFELLSWAATVAFVPALVRGFAWFGAPIRPLVIRTVGWTELALAAVFGILLIWGLAAA